MPVTPIRVMDSGRCAMRPTFWLIFMLFAASGVAGAAGTPVVKADTTTKNPVIDNNLTGNSSAFYLWSNLTGPNIARGGPNEFTDLFNPFGSIAKPIPETKSLITVGQKTYPDAGGKNVGKTKVDKPAPQAPQTAQDSSEALGDPNNTLYKVASEGKVMTGDKKQFSASAQRSTGALGSAAAATYDPGQLAAPPLGYYPLSFFDNTGTLQDVYLIDATLGPSAPGEYQAVAFMALDSRFGPTFPDNFGDPANNLWTLTIVALRPITSISDLLIDFTINPLATIAGGGTQDILTDASDQALSIGAVLSQITGALTIADGVATLAPVDPFPVGTRYHVDQTITYGVADAAALTAAPEPSSVWLLGFGSLLLLWRSRTHRELAQLGCWIDRS